MSVDRPAESKHTATLKAQLDQYAAQGIYPFHMPGHKRILAPAPGLPFDMDMTEVEGVDDLHHAEGILKDAMDRTAHFFGARKTWYLVGGSTVGNLAGIRALAPYGSEIIAARNCHKSVFHAAELGNLRIHWAYPEYDPDFEICGSVKPGQIARLLDKYPASRMVILTSPTYEGILSDIRSIAGICHDHGIPLMVDEAHGAHLGLFPGCGFPEGSIHLGADLVVQSAHKTLPSLTQTAFLHAGGNLVSEKEIQRNLGIFETSSPSYPLMASLDGCTGILMERGRDLFEDWQERLKDFSAFARGLKRVEIMCYGEDRLSSHPAFFDRDPSKILIRLPGMSGGMLASLLRRQYQLETEMHEGENVLAMTSPADHKEGMERLKTALQELDQNAPTLKLDAVRTGNRDQADLDLAATSGRTMILPGDAVLRNRKEISLSEASGQISAEYIMAYPPGIPLVAPGEVVTEKAVLAIRRLADQGGEILHSLSGQDSIMVIQ